MSRNFV